MSKLREKVFAAFNAKFVKDGRVGRGTQGAQAIALDFGLIPPGQTAAAEKILLDDIASRGCALTTGIFGTRALLRHLSRSGHLDVAARLVLRREFPGWLHMLDRGATTLWETWKEETLIFSHDHPMFGSVDGWMIETVLGVRIGEGGRVEIDPKPVPGVEWARGSFRMPDGSVRRIEWGSPR